VTRLPTASLSPASCPCRGVCSTKPPDPSPDSKLSWPSWEAWTGDNINTSSSNRGSMADAGRLVGSRLLLLNRQVWLTSYLTLHHLPRLFSTENRMVSYLNNSIKFVIIFDSLHSTYVVHCPMSEVYLTHITLWELFLLIFKWRESHICLTFCLQHY
jgi:hypothetical protein